MVLNKQPTAVLPKPDIFQEEKYLRIAIYIGIRKREKTSTPSLPETYSQEKQSLEKALPSRPSGI